MCTLTLARAAARRFSLALGALACCMALVATETAGAQGIVQKIEDASDRVELTVNSSKILTLEHRFTRAQVDNKELLALTPLSPNQIQVAANKAGVTQINFWDDTGKVYGLDVIIYGDAKELEMALKTLYPECAVRVYRLSNSLILDGFVDRPDSVSQIIRIAEDYSTKVVNKMQVAGVHQILLNVQVMEVSRTKLRQFGFDFAALGDGDYFTSGVSGLLSSVSSDAGVTSVASSNGAQINFGVINSDSTFFGFLEALRQNDLMKILSEPKIVAVSGRPASFNVGGEIPILVPQSLGTVSVEFEPFGTQVDFVPLVLGNGRIRLEVRPRISEIDSTLNATIPGSSISTPGFRVREVDTAVEMKAGQTLAIAGLIQSRTEAQTKAVPFLGELPWIGAGFRRVEERVNEIELLILVRPELVDALDPDEVPPGGPGLDTTSPSDHDLFFRGHLEVPKCCDDGSCPECQSGGTLLPPVEAPMAAPTPPVNETAYPLISIPAKVVESPVSTPAINPAPRLNAPEIQRTPVVSSPAVNTSVVRMPPVSSSSSPVLLPTHSNPTNSSNPAARQPVVNSDFDQAPPGLIGPVGYDVK